MSRYVYKPYDCDGSDEARKSYQPGMIDFDRDFDCVEKVVGKGPDMVYLKAREEARLEVHKFLARKFGSEFSQESKDFQKYQAGPLTQMFNYIVMEKYQYLLSLKTSISRFVCAKVKNSLDDSDFSLIEGSEIISLENGVVKIQIARCEICRVSARGEFVEEIIVQKFESLSSQYVRLEVAKIESDLALTYAEKFSRILRLSSSPAASGDPEVCVRCDRVLMIGINVSNSVQKICESCVSRRAEGGDESLILTCCICSNDLSKNVLTNLFSLTCIKCSLRIVSGCSPPNLIKCFALENSDLNFQQQVLQLSDCDSGNFVISSSSMDIIDSLRYPDDDPIVNDLRRVRLSQIRFLCDHLGFEMKTQEMWDLTRLCLNNIAKFFFDSKNRWGINNITKWFLSIVPSELHWGENKLNYLKILPYVKDGVGSICDFGCGSGYGVVQLQDASPMSRVVGYDVVNSLDPSLKVNYISEIVEQFDIVVVNNVLHHVCDVNDFVHNLTKAIGPSSRVIIKDHIATNWNILLIVLLHLCYSGGKRELLIFRSYYWMLGMMTELGARVTCHEYRNDIGDLIFEGFPIE